jgi:acyl carrier protein
VTKPTSRPPAIEELLALPWSERLPALEELVAAAFRETLLMAEDEELPLDQSYFDLGLTSLRLTETKRRLEDLLDCSISANTVFNQPTVRQLVDHLASEVLDDIFGQSAPAAVPAVADESRTQEHELLGDALKDLYQS